MSAEVTVARVVVDVDKHGRGLGLRLELAQAVGRPAVERDEHGRVGNVRRLHQRAGSR
jgi:hypothetical protein